MTHISYQVLSMRQSPVSLPNWIFLMPPFMEPQNEKIERKGLSVYPAAHSTCEALGGIHVHLPGTYSSHAILLDLLPC